ncbi:MAG: hypothetical protein JXB49_09620 [Bacteroidales bacterium]|nr:hypothetical protein [Bacteroidales bacterium]
MKKKILFVSFLITIAVKPIIAQDIIVKKDYSEIKAKVIEIQENLIKYKPYDFLDGPLRNIYVSDVLRIVYENGKIESFTVPEERKPVIQPVTSNAPTSQPYYRESTDPTFYPLRLFIRASIQAWRNDELSDFFENNALFGAGIEKQVSDDFKFGADFDFTSKSQYEVTLNYFQFGAFMKYSWYPFGSNRPNICGGLGIKGVSLKEMEDDYSDKWSSVGFSVLVAVEIPLGTRVILDLGWNTVWATVKIEEESLNVGSDNFYAGLIFNLW